MLWAFKMGESRKRVVAVTAVKGKYDIVSRSIRGGCKDDDKMRDGGRRRGYVHNRNAYSTRTQAGT